MAQTEAKANPNALSVDELFKNNVNNVVPVDLDQEMRRSFIDYAMSVISDRALPDARDGLKPVHRRILYSMFTQGFTPDKPYRKCATTVGDVLGRFHPHGDAAVYDALVRLAQDFSMRFPLVDGHGNFGSRDGDAAAAYRYTEARLTKLALEMMGDINKQTVDFRPNFDEHEMEPIVLPTHFPNLLVNGSTGIAVGMATSIPPHNLEETVEAAIHLMKHPDADVDALMQFVQAPDFPTGGTIMGLAGVREFYRTGRGRIVVRASAEIEEMGGGRQRIVVHDLPYMVNKARLLERISDQVKAKRIEGISHLRDESDRNDAVRIVIELKRDANANLTLNQLYKYTELQDSFSANMLALVPDQHGVFVPRTLNLKEALACYVSHQKEVVTRKFRFDLEKAEARRHIVEGLRIAIDFIDEVIRIIRNSKTESEAKERLCERFNFSDRQAQHIVDMRLGRLTGLERDKLEAEFNELCERIERIGQILADEQLLIAEIEKDLRALLATYADERRTKIDPFGVDGIADEHLIKREEVALTLTRLGYIKRIPVETYEIQHRGGRGITGMSTREEDMVQTLLTASSHDTILFFTNTGRVFRKKGYEIPEGGRQARGMAIVNLLQLEADEKIVGLIAVKEFTADLNLIIATKRGLVKKTDLMAYSRIHTGGIIAVNLRENDQVVSVQLIQDDCDLVLVTEQGNLIRFKPEEVRETGRNTFGVRGISLREDDAVMTLLEVDEKKELVFCSENGFGKRTRFDEFKVQRRGGMGIRCYGCNEKTGRLVSAAAVAEDEELILMNDAGIMIRIPVSEISVLGRYASGVTVMRCGEGVHVVDLAVVAKAPEQGTASSEASKTDQAEELASSVEASEAQIGAMERSELKETQGAQILDTEENRKTFEAFFEKTGLKHEPEEDEDEDASYTSDWSEDASMRLRSKEHEDLEDQASEEDEDI